MDDFAVQSHLAGVFLFTKESLLVSTPIRILPCLACSTAPTHLSMHVRSLHANAPSNFGYHVWILRESKRILLNVRITLFAAEYEIGTPAPGTPCSFTVDSEYKRNGNILSPTYPGTYPKGLTCSYQFIGKESQRVRLEFRDFDLFFGGQQYVRVFYNQWLTNR